MKVSKKLLFVTSLVVLFSCYSISGYAVTYETEQIVSGLVGMVDVNDNGQVVWSDYTHPEATSSNIFLYGETGIVQLTNDIDRVNHNPKIANNGHIAWLKVTPGTDPTLGLEIMLLDDSGIRPLAADGAYDVQINNNGQVLWKDISGILHLYNGSRIVDVPMPLSITYAREYHLNDNGSIVFAADDRVGGFVNKVEICYFDGATTVNLTNNGDYVGWPQINNLDQMVWSDGINLFTCFPDTTQRRLGVGDGARQGFPKINNSGQIICQTEPYSADWGEIIYIRLFEEGNLTELRSPEHAINTNPEISDNGYVAWIAHNKDDWRNAKLFVYDGLDTTLVGDNSATIFQIEINANGDIVYNTADGVYLATPVTESTPQPKFILEATTIIDDWTGESYKVNGDKRLNPGEKVELQLKMRNIGNAPAHDVSVLLYIDPLSNDIGIVNGYVAYSGSIEPGEAAIFDEKFVIEARENDPMGSYFSIAMGKVDVMTTGLNWSTDVELKVVPPAERTAEQKLVAEGSSEQLLKMSSDYNGNVYTAWIDNQTEETIVYFKVSRDYGITWTDKVRLNVGEFLGNSLEEIEQVEIVSDVTGHVCVLLRGDRRIYYNYSEDYGATWMDRVRPATPYGPNGWVGIIRNNMEICSDNDGHVYVCWQGEENRLYVNYSYDYGKSWSSDLGFISKRARVAFISDLSCDDRGNVYAVWQDSRNDGNYPYIYDDVYFNVSNNYGRTWNEEDLRLDVLGAPAEKAAVAPQISSDENENVYVVWNQLDDGVYVRVSHDKGDTWQEPVEVSTPESYQFANARHQICSDENGNVYVTWYGMKGRIESFVSELGMFFNVSHDQGDSWGTDPILLGSINRQDLEWRPKSRITCDNNGNVYAVRQSNLADETFSILLRKSGDFGETWSEDIKLDTNVYTGNLLFPVMNSDENGNVYVTWCNLGDVYFLAYVVNPLPVLAPMFTTYNGIEGLELDVTVRALDPDEKQLDFFYDIRELPLDENNNFTNNATFSAPVLEDGRTTSKLLWTPPSGAEGTYEPVYIVTRNPETDRYAFRNISIEVSAPIIPPYFDPEPQDQTVEAGEALSFTTHAVNPNGNGEPIYYWVTFYNEALDIDENGAVDIGDYNVIFSALGTRVGESGYVARADLDSNGIIDFSDLIYFYQQGSICEEGVSFDETTGAFNWTPIADQEGTYEVTLSVLYQVVYPYPAVYTSKTVTITVTVTRPQITRIWPYTDGNEIEVGGSFAVIGKNFGVFQVDGDSYVKLNDQKIEVSYWSSSYMSCKVPDGFQLGDAELTVTTQKGTSDPLTVSVIKSPELTLTYPEYNKRVAPGYFRVGGTKQGGSILNDQGGIAQAAVAELIVWVYDYGQRTYTLSNHSITCNSANSSWSIYMAEFMYINGVRKQILTRGANCLIWVRAKDTNGALSPWKNVRLRIAEPAEVTMVSPVAGGTVQPTGFEVSGTVVSEAIIPDDGIFVYVYDTQTWSIIAYDSAAYNAATGQWSLNIPGDNLVPGQVLGCYVWALDEDGIYSDFQIVQVTVGEILKAEIVLPETIKQYEGFDVIVNVESAHGIPENGVHVRLEDTLHPGRELQSGYAHPIGNGQWKFRVNGESVDVRPGININFWVNVVDTETNTRTPFASQAVEASSVAVSASEAVTSSSGSDSSSDYSSDSGSYSTSDSASSSGSDSSSSTSTDSGYYY